MYTPFAAFDCCSKCGLISQKVQKNATAKT